MFTKYVKYDIINLSQLSRGLVKWYNNGLQNHCWEFDSLIPCHNICKIKSLKSNINLTSKKEVRFFKRKLLY